MTNRELFSDRFWRWLSWHLPDRLVFWTLNRVALVSFGDTAPKKEFASLLSDWQLMTRP